jgi:hypothetical protein
MKVNNTDTCLFISLWSALGTPVNYIGSSIHWLCNQLLHVYSRLDSQLLVLQNSIRIQHLGNYAKSYTQYYSKIVQARLGTDMVRQFMMYTDGA